LINGVAVSQVRVVVVNFIGTGILFFNAKPGLETPDSDIG